MEILLAIAIAVVVALFIGWLISVRPDPPDTVLMNNPEYWLDKDIKDLEQALAITPQSGKIDEDMDEDMSVHDAISQALAFRRRTIENAGIEHRMASYIATAKSPDHDTTLVLKDQ